MDFMVRTNEDFYNRLIALVDATATTVFPTDSHVCANVIASGNNENAHRVCGGHGLSVMWLLTRRIRRRHSPRENEKVWGTRGVGGEIRSGPPDEMHRINGRILTLVVCMSTA
jgi:hypothetical protein